MRSTEVTSESQTEALMQRAVSVCILKGSLSMIQSSPLTLSLSLALLLTHAHTHTRTHTPIGGFPLTLWMTTWPDASQSLSVWLPVFSPPETFITAPRHAGEGRLISCVPGSCMCEIGQFIALKKINPIICFHTAPLPALRKKKKERESLRAVVFDHWEICWHSDSQNVAPFPFLSSWSQPGFQ